MFKNKLRKINIGDQVLVAVDGEIKELEVIDIPVDNLKEGKILSFLSRHPSLITVKLPDGRNLDCRYFPISH